MLLRCQKDLSLHDGDGVIEVIGKPEREGVEMGGVTFEFARREKFQHAQNPSHVTDCVAPCGVHPRFFVRVASSSDTASFRGHFAATFRDDK
jgi:hypothetical protein